MCVCVCAVADLGFPRGGCANTKGEAPTYYWPNFSRKLHENEEILAERGGRPGACVCVWYVCVYLSVCP